jgi:hypothetical protein
VGLFLLLVCTWEFYCEPMWRCVKLNRMLDQRRNHLWNMAVVSCFWFVIQDGTATEAKAARAIVSSGDSLLAGEPAGTVLKPGARQTIEHEPNWLHRIAAVTAQAANGSFPNSISSPPASASSPADKSNAPNAQSTTVAAAQLPAESAKAEEAKSRSILQMLEGHEIEFKIGLIVAAIAFALGWLCGGTYYARRERKSRHRLRF